MNIFDYISWIETEVENILINKYDWETDPGTTSTWRIGDGTTAFYNYIYYVVAGFTENDTFRSNQIREGLITRKEALRKLEIENHNDNLRFESSNKWTMDKKSLMIALDLIKKVIVSKNDLDE